MKGLDFSSKHHVASLLLRASVGSMFLLHGIGKVFVVGMSQVISGFASQGFPIWTAHVSTLIEIVAGLLLVIGLHTRIAALLLFPISIGILIYHVPNGWVFHAPGGGWEYPQLICVSLSVIFLLGTDKHKTNPKND